jgi:hypothetical protein
MLKLLIHIDIDDELGSRAFNQVRTFNLYLRAAASDIAVLAK